MNVEVGFRFGLGVYIDRRKPGSGDRWAMAGRSSHNTHTQQQAETETRVLRDINQKGGRGQEEER
jgi:hypothetical protein